MEDYIEAHKFSNNHMEQLKYRYNYKDVFVDASGKFLILTEPGTKPGDIAAVVK